jgi:SAM-dependent methyltransferase
MSPNERWPCRPRARACIETRPPVSDRSPQRTATPAEEAAAIARYYDLDVAHERDDLDMYLALASASDGPILEIACGTGRICVPLAAAGHDVTGVDIDAAMLERARANWAERQHAGEASGSLALVEQDALAMEIGRKFDLVILGFNSLLVMGNGHAATQRSALEAMTRHLADDGRAVIDTWLPDAEDLEVYDGRTVREWTRRDPESGEQVTKSVSATFDPLTRRATIETHFDVATRSMDRGAIRRTTRRDEVHFPTRDELLGMVESTGLDIQQIAGDYAMRPLEPDSERVIVVTALGRSSPNSAQ